MRAPLSGCRVWLTRPAHQAEGWAAALEAAGATVLREPLLTIEPPADIEAARAGLIAAEAADRILATSTNAVDAAWRLKPDFAPQGTLYGVGAASADALEAASGRPVARPSGAFTSERLLALESLASLHGQRAAVLSGEGGRTALADTLAARGAAVTRVALYRRRGADIGPARLARLLDRADAVVVTSGEALAHLLTLAGDDHRAALARLRLVAPSRRVVQQADQGQGWTRAPVVVDRMSGEAVVTALARVWRGDRQ
ncbi:uroporphyrinogen-III synthase [Salinisphaera orenii]|uniref:Uroporphyrinogen-III synthase n=1 Tax=Salinisphaera orenii YIM 95161 TaxID=1051139 RepID=A0A423PI05_9GAMM|nr:uroporphyrinogen-III synthase [Salinisphaera halophila]ROO25227.1 uroporphyrinogen III synthase [Salinisphaera halophila YIM 95161]